MKQRVSSSLATSDELYDDDLSTSTLRRSLPYKTSIAEDTALVDNWVEHVSTWCLKDF